MRVAVLADIHGNAAALRAVLEDVRRQSVERLLVAGDLVGYYYYPDEALDLLAARPFDIVQGNHEGMLAAAINDTAAADEYRRRYGHGLDAARARLATAALDFLCTLPPRRDLALAGRRIVLCHGSPWDRDQYVYPDAHDDVLARCAEPGADLVVMGHTHYPLLRRVAATLLLNPGAVGQPRDGDPRAAWAVIDLQRMEACLHRTGYPVEAVAALARQYDPGVPYLADVLLPRPRVPAAPP